MALKCTFSVDPELLDALSGCLFEAGAEGLLEGPTGDSLVTFVASERELGPLGEAFRTFEENARAAFPEAEHYSLEVEEADESWRETWLLALDAERVTERFVLRPLHRPDRDEDEVTLWYRPTASFGSGGHPTTRLVSRALEEIGASSPGLSLFDVGTGTGVLALVALKSGFSKVVGSDIDEVSVASLVENAEHNGLRSQITALLGSADAIAEEFPVVAANIGARVLFEIAPDLALRTERGGALLLAGFLEEDTPALLARFESFGFEKKRDENEAGWEMLWLEKKR